MKCFTIFHAFLKSSFSCCYSCTNHVASCFLAQLHHSFAVFTTTLPSSIPHKKGRIYESWIWDLHTTRFEILCGCITPFFFRCCIFSCSRIFSFPMPHWLCEKRQIKNCFLIWLLRRFFNFDIPFSSRDNNQSAGQKIKKHSVCRTYFVSFNFVLR